MDGFTVTIAGCWNIWGKKWVILIVMEYMYIILKITEKQHVYTMGETIQKQLTQQQIFFKLWIIFPINAL